MYILTEAGGEAEGEEGEAHLCMSRIGDLHSPLPALQSLGMDKQYRMDQDQSHRTCCGLLCGRTST